MTLNAVSFRQDTHVCRKDTKVGPDHFLPELEVGPRRPGERLLLHPVGHREKERRFPVRTGMEPGRLPKEGLPHASLADEDEGTPLMEPPEACDLFELGLRE